MKSTPIVSSRGQITLPSKIRKKYGINEESVLVAEDRDGEIVLTLAATVEAEDYMEDQIQEWVMEDTYQNENEQGELEAKVKNIALKK